MSRDLVSMPIWRSAIAALAVIAIAAAIAAQLWIPLGDPVPGEFSDSVDYLLFADYFHAAFSRTLTPDLSSFFSVTRFPPLFPLAIYAVGGGLSTPMAAYWLDAALMIGNFAMIGVWLVRECESRTAGLLLAGFVALAPGLQLLSLNPASEPLFLLLTIATLLWLPRVERGKASLLVFAAFVGLLPLCRMAGIAAVIAIAIRIALNRDAAKRQRLTAIVIMLLPPLAWLSYRKLMPVTHSYVDALSLDRVLATFGSWQGLILGQPLRIASTYFDLLSPWMRLPDAITFGSALVAMLGWWTRLRRRAADAQLLTIYVGLVFVWPYPAEVARLLSVTLPLVALCFWEGTRWMIGRLPAWRSASSAGAAAIVAAGMAVISGPFLIESANRAFAPVDPELEPFKRTSSFFRRPSRSDALEMLELDARVAGVMDAAATIVGPGDCLLTFFRNAVLVHAPEVDTRPMPYPIPQGSMLREILGDCRYVLVTYQTSAQLHQPLLYPLNQAREQLHPLLISSMHLRGREIVAAGLFDVAQAPSNP